MPASHPNIPNTTTIPLTRTCCIEAVPNRMRRPIEVNGLEIRLFFIHFKGKWSRSCHAFFLSLSQSRISFGYKNSCCDTFCRKKKRKSFIPLAMTMGSFIDSSNPTSMFQDGSLAWPWWCPGPPTLGESWWLKPWVCLRFIHTPTTVCKLDCTQYILLCGVLYADNDTDMCTYMYSIFVLIYSKSCLLSRCLVQCQKSSVVRILATIFQDSGPIMVDYGNRYPLRR